jgi:chromosome segregation ATPase
MDREAIEEITRHCDAVSEETGSQIAAVSDALGRLTERVGEHDQKLDAFRQEVRKEFDETRSMIRVSYGELERRIIDLETRVDDLSTRMERVETHLR